MVLITAEEYESYSSTMNDFDHAILGACEMNFDGENTGVQEALSLGLTDPISLSHESPASALLDQLNQRSLGRNQYSLRRKTERSRRGFDRCTGILTVALSYAHFEDNSSKLSQEQAERSIDLALKIAEAQPHEIKFLRFWVDQMLPEKQECQSFDDFTTSSLLPFYRLPVVSVAKESSIRRSLKLMIENAIISQSSTSLPAAEGGIPRLCPFPAASDSAEYKVASMIIAGLFDGIDYATLEDEELKVTDIIQWACKLFCNSKEMKKIYKINVDISDKAGYGFFMGADWWWCTTGKNTCQSRNQRRYHSKNQLSDASMIGMSSRSFALLSAQDQEDFRTFMAGFSHYTPRDMLEHQYYGTTFPLSYIWVNLSCDSIGPYLNMEYIQSENALCPVRNASFSIGSKKLGLMKKRRRISNVNCTSSLYNNQFSLMQKERMLSSDYLRKIGELFETHPINVSS